MEALVALSDGYRAQSQPEPYRLLDRQICADKSAIAAIDDVLASPEDFRGKARIKFKVSAEVMFDRFEVRRENIDSVINEAFTAAVREAFSDKVQVMKQLRAALVSRVAEYEAARDRLA